MVHLMRENEKSIVSTDHTSRGSFTMPVKRSSEKSHVKYHKDGTIWAKGETIKGVPTGSWEWFRIVGLHDVVWKSL